MSDAIKCAITNDGIRYVITNDVVKFAITNYVIKYAILQNMSPIRKSTIICVSKYASATHARCFVLVDIWLSLANYVLN